MDDADKDVVLVRQRIAPGKTDDLRAWFAERLADEEAVRSRLRERGIAVESVFIHSTPDGDFLLYFAEAEDFDAALREVAGPDRELDRECRDFLEETHAGGVDAGRRTRAELLFHIVVRADRR